MKTLISLLSEEVVRSQKNNSKLYRKIDVAKQVKHRYKQKAKQKHDILSIDNSTEQKESIFSKLFPKVRHLLFG